MPGRNAALVQFLGDGDQRVATISESMNLGENGNLSRVAFQMDAVRPDAPPIRKPADPAASRLSCLQRGPGSGSNQRSFEFRDCQQTCRTMYSTRDGWDSSRRAGARDIVCSLHSTRCSRSARAPEQALTRSHARAGAYVPHNHVRAIRRTPAPVVGLVCSDRSRHVERRVPDRVLAPIERSEREGPLPSPCPE